MTATRPRPGWPVLPVEAPDGEVVAELRPLAASDVADDALVADLTAWRQRAMRFFLTRFEASENRTRAWLGRVCDDPDRVLFLIVLPDGRRVGHYALIRRDGGVVEMDNSILGEPVGVRRLMLHTEHALLAWVFGEQGIERATARLLDGNVTCFSMHKATGFRFLSSSDLLETRLENGDTLLQPADAAEPADAVRSGERLITMELAAGDYWPVRLGAGYPPRQQRPSPRAAG